VLCSVVVPVAILTYIMRLRKVSRAAVLGFGLFLLLLSALDLVLLQHIAGLARTSASLLDDQIFLSELPAALYLLPLTSAGIGINLVSQVLLEHLRQAERNYDKLQD